MSRMGMRNKQLEEQLSWKHVRINKLYHSSPKLYILSPFYQISNFGMCAILSQSSPLCSSHRFFNVEQPRIGKTSSEVRCRIPSGKDLSPSHWTISIVQRESRPSQSFSGKDSRSPQRLIHRCSKDRLKDSFGNSINFRKSDIVSVWREVRFLNMPSGSDVASSFLWRWRVVRP